MPARPQDDEAFLRSVHLLVMDVRAAAPAAARSPVHAHCAYGRHSPPHPLRLQIHVMEATLVCPHCARRYPICRGVPNMLLREDEV